MQRIEVNTLGFKLTKEVPSTVDEYNALAPKRENACLEDAISNSLYRGTLAEFRGTFLEKLGEAEGVERINHGTDDEPQLESEAKWFKRIQAKNGGVNKPEWATLAQQVMDASAFDPSERERKSDGPRIGKRDLEIAKELIGRGPEMVAKAASVLSAKIGRPVETAFEDDKDNEKLAKSLALAFADKRRAETRAAEEAQRQELGLA